MNHKNSREKRRVLLCGNIFHKVLIAVQKLSCIEGKSPKLEEIDEYMQRNYSIEGDGYSQILNALDRGLRNGFLHKRKNRYAVICPAATISCKNKPRLFEMERIRSIFESREALHERKQSAKRNISKSRSQPKKKRRAHSCGHVDGASFDMAKLENKRKANLSQGETSIQYTSTPSGKVCGNNLPTHSNFEFYT